MTTTLTRLQEGYANLGTTWVETTISLSTALSTTHGGARFTAVQTEIYTAATLRCTLAAATTGTGTLTASVVPLVQPTAFATANLPGTLSEVELGTLAVTSGLAIGANLDITLTAGEMASYYRTRTAAVTAPQLAIDIEWDGASVIAFNTSMIVTAINENTGMLTPWPPKSSRVAHDDRAGIMMLREDMVKDGYREGSWVHPDWADPPVDPRRDEEFDPFNVEWEKEPLNED